MTQPGQTPNAAEPPQDAQDPLHAFRFRVELAATEGGTDLKLCRGAFSEVSGLEATMEPVAIGEGGRNWGQVQRVGRTTFSTVILRRGMTTTRHLWSWFAHVARDGKVAYRLQAKIVLQGLDGTDRLEWKLLNALPVKLKLADLNATAAEVGIEELHLVHEGIEEVVSSAAAGGQSPPAGGGQPAGGAR